MSGIQKSVAEGLRYLANGVEEGCYGIGDDAFQDELSREAFMEDLSDEVTDKMY